MSNGAAEEKQPPISIDRSTSVENVKSENKDQEPMCLWLDWTRRSTNVYSKMGPK